MPRPVAFAGTHIDIDLALPWFRPLRIRHPPWFDGYHAGGGLTGKLNNTCDLNPSFERFVRLSQALTVAPGNAASG